MKRNITILIVVTLLVSIISFSGLGVDNLNRASACSYIPTFSIVKVLPDQTVKIQTYNFPAGDTFKVMMNYMGTRGVNGIVVDKIATGDGGSFTKTFSIPSALQGQYQIAIRLQSTSGSGYYAYNWFYNNVSKSGTGGAYSSLKGYKGYPYIKVLDVVKNKTVKLQISNLPKNDKYRVLLGKIGTLGVNGVKVGTFTTGDGGTLTVKVKIPSSLKGKPLIAVRIESIAGTGYYAYNWFYNK